MSFETHMRPLINTQLGLDSENPDTAFYIRNTTKALNGYLSELEETFAKRHLLVTGATVLPFTPPVTTPVMNRFGYFVPNHVRIDEEEVKNALWCGDPSMSFVNLFVLFGNKMCQNFNRVTSTTRNVAELQSAPAVPYVCNGIGVVNMTFAHYASYAARFIAAAKALGTTLDAYQFLSLESKYLRLAISTTPPCPVFISGLCLSTNGMAVNGVFTGTLEASFAATT